MTQVQTNPVRVIKKYANRKLYDVETSSYVSLKAVGDMVREGRDIQVIDNVTKADVTGTTLLGAISEHTDIDGHAGILRDILKAGGLGTYVEALKGGK